MRFSERGAICPNTSIHCATRMKCSFTMKMLQLQRKSLSFASALKFYEAFTKISHKFFQMRRILFKYFNSLFEVNGVLNDFLKVVISEKSLCFVSALRFQEAFTKFSHAFLSQRSSLFKHFTSLCKVNGVWRNFVNAVVSQKISLFCKCMKIL